MRKIIATSALPYANGSIHLGHLVEYIQTDIWVRYQRLVGNEIHYICADDTHGTPIMLRAEKEGISPEQLVENVHKEHSADFSDFNISFDNFYSTNSIENKNLSEALYNSLVGNNKIEAKEIEQFYDDEKNMFLPDRFIKGTCPKCKANDQYGDSCESCGTTYSPTDLIDAYSVLTGSKPVKKKTEHYFFKLSECESFLSEWTQSDTLQKEALNKLQEWFKAGLADWDISRDAPYFGFEIPGAPGKYFYVWLDAPIGYMASFKNYADKNNLSYDEFWNKDSTTELVHFIGKDILYFHALFWPATLKYSGHRTPSKIYAHGFLTVNGEKMSKSRGTFITARSYIDAFKTPDYLRYYYFSKLNDSMGDIDLSLDDFIVKVNSDLIGKLVNIPSRTSGFVTKFFDNKIMLTTDFNESESQILVNNILLSKDEVTRLFEARQFSKICRLLISHVESVNEFVNNKEPWILAKDDAHKMNNSYLHEVCSAALQSFRLLSIYLSPIMPDLTKKIASFFNQEEFSSIDNLLSDVTTIKNYEHLLKRVEQKDVDIMVESNKNN
ncbi:methionine--tRNA ligase [Methylophilaceae bacterium]|jgi:methionyl-tRNA synthetase|nr:methionine--tRNA ligase [Betaproteobacteria bacterium]MDA9085814.1 methionine--tRNA ligase [Methylophilaceae bacterium]MCH9842179.1 methionine--tRNA ligase [Betaproteobacteria bacterium]MDA9087773.1 methionine--tRNA ligase [Methylophilaceae bacterium]MDA9096910.1 methionine--tRNA ligase [Methylophilaceae bacterium]